MKTKNTNQDKLEELRKKAEGKLAIQPEKGSSYSRQDMENIVHEMHVYQIELEMQNDELRKTQQELEESLSRYTDLYDYAPVGYLTFDKNGVILKVNLTAAKMLGRERAFIMNHPFAIFLNHEGKQIFYRHLHDVFDAKTTQTVELTVNRSDNTKFFAHFDSVIITDGDNECRQCSVTFSDISERHLLETKLEEKNKELTDFAYRISHDFKSIITIISAYGCEIEQDPSKFSQLFPHIKNNLNKASLFIERLLKLAAAGKVIGSKEEINIRQVLDYVLGTLKHDECPLQTAFNLNYPTVSGDLASMILVFLNLIENAIKYCDPKKEALVIEFSSKEEKGSVIISVKDNGIGIEEKNLGLIFLPGFVVSKDKGTGFGLAIVKKIVEAHKGSIMAKSQGKTHGIEIIIKMPIATETNP
jgi:PAS domain S-box-containing protein